ncbi:MAG TPA: HIT domain-containing protein [Candidatus Sulfomarinibacteraceae bacterium]|nr:HIT domain-containing protein [Candidatus Sulfomarinibacteraceae bacterium]
MSFLMRVARSPLGRLLVGKVFTHMSFLLPVERLRETETLIAFHHPRPSSPVHILLVPRRSLRGLADLGPDDAGFLAELLEMVNELVQEFDLERRGYRLIVNGGAYQDVPHLHFHLISEN